MATIKSKRKQIEQSEATTILKTVKNLDLGSVISEVSNLQISVQKTLADLGATVTNKVQQVDQLDTAIALKEIRLEELLGIEKEGLSLDEMRARSTEESVAWEKNRIEREKRWSEEESEYAKTRNRNEDNWKYEFEQRKKRLQEEFSTEVQKTKVAEQLRHDSLERIWTERENTLKSREQEYTALKAQVENHAAQMDAAVKQAEARGAAAVTAKFNHEIALLKKDTEAQKSMADLRIASLNETIDGLHVQIENMQAHLTLARQDAKEIASEALKGAGNRGVADALQRVIDSQQSSVKTK